MLNHGSRKSRSPINVDTTDADFSARRHKRAVSLPGDLLIRLEVASDMTDVPQSRIIERALRAHLNCPDPRAAAVLTLVQP